MPLAGLSDASVCDTLRSMDERPKITTHVSRDFQILAVGMLLGAGSFLCYVLIYGGLHWAFACN